MINQNFIIVGAIIAAIGSLSYLIDTLKGKVKPNRVSYLLWSLAPLIAFVAEIKQGVGLQSLLTFVAGFLPLTVFLASFVNKKAGWKLTFFDGTCGVLSCIGLILWYITQSGDIAILFSILADGLAALPTLIKSFNYPETESAWPYFMSTIFGVITLLTVKEWNFATIGFPVYITLVTLTISSLVQFELGKVFRSYFDSAGMS
ncbi:MAG TPA: hypothetical protein VFA41_03390 [Ktedonobacteraceae bacterium]|jgi:hypothetical protein|nr:hypothetical protein [Ktedonobacteraceae bacterium]